MKKALLILAVLCVAATVFAATGFTVKGGPAFAFVNGRTITENDRYSKYKTHGFGFDVEVEYNVSDSLLVFADFNMVFPGNLIVKYYGSNGNLLITYNYKKDIESVNKYAGREVASFKVNIISLSAGVAYKLDVKPFKLALGGGLTFNRVLFKYNYLFTESRTYINLGLTGFAEAKYMVADSLGITLTVMPQVTAYNIHTSKRNLINEVVSTDKGFAFGFAMPVTLGVAYSF